MIASGEMRRHALYARVSACLLMLCAFQPPAIAQTSVEELQRRLNQREKLIDELARRVEALEQKLGTAESAKTRPRSGDRTDMPASSTVAGEAAAAAQVPASGPGAPATQAEEEQANRALERALVREGGLVLPRGTFEIEPAVTYRHRATAGLDIVSVGAGPAVTRQVGKRDILEPSVAVRAGLPWNSQVGFRMPYLYTRDQLASGGATEETRRSGGWGDPELTWTTQFVREGGGLPGVLGTVSWTAPTGSFRLTDITSPGSGFHVVQAGLNAVKRQDPMVFYSSVVHAWALSKRLGGTEIDPGDTTSLKLGAILAASPDTSLRFAFEMSRGGKLELNGRRQPGSDTSVALLEFGLVSALTARSVLDLRVGIGLTPDSPNYRIGLALPLRFY